MNVKTELPVGSHIRSRSCFKKSMTRKRTQTSIQNPSPGTTRSMADETKVLAPATELRMIKIEVAAFVFVPDWRNPARPGIELLVELLSEQVKAHRQRKSDFCCR